MTRRDPRWISFLIAIVSCFAWWTGGVFALAYLGAPAWLGVVFGLLFMPVWTSTVLMEGIDRLIDKRQATNKPAPVTPPEVHYRAPAAHCPSCGALKKEARK